MDELQIDMEPLTLEEEKIWEVFRRSDLSGLRARFRRYSVEELRQIVLRCAHYARWTNDELIYRGQPCRWCGRWTTFGWGARNGSDWTIGYMSGLICPDCY